MSYKSATPQEIFERINSGKKFRFIDVREPLEYEIARIEQAELLPMSRIGDWIGTLDPEEETVVMCHHGIRSANVCQFLIRNGFKNVSNLEGGIDLWSATVDENVPRY